MCSSWVACGDGRRYYLPCFWSVFLRSFFRLFASTTVLMRCNLFIGNVSIYYVRSSLMAQPPSATATFQAQYLLPYPAVFSSLNCILKLSKIRIQRYPYHPYIPCSTLRECIGIDMYSPTGAKSDLMALPVLLAHCTIDLIPALCRGGQ